MSVCHLTSVHIPFDTRIFHKECLSLVRAGFDVHLVACHDRVETIEGIHIHGISHRTRKLERMVFTVFDAARKALSIDADIYHFHDPELIPVGLILKLMGKKVIYDVHEDYPDYIRYKDAIPLCFRKPVAWMTGLIEHIAVPFFDAVVAVTPHIHDRMKTINNRTVEICNFPSCEELFSGDELPPWNSRLDAVTYIGSISPDRSIEEMLEAVAIVNRAREVRLILGGTFTSAALETSVRHHPGFRYVDYLGQMSRAQVVNALSQAKAGLIVMHPNSHLLLAFPTKLFEYMMAGIPVIASDSPIVREIVETSGCGILVEPKNTVALAEAITIILDNAEKAEAMGARGRKTAMSQYTWASEEKKLLELYHSIDRMVKSSKHTA